MPSSNICLPESFADRDVHAAHFWPGDANKYRDFWERLYFPDLGSFLSLFIFPRPALLAGGRRVEVELLPGSLE